MYCQPLFFFDGMNVPLEGKNESEITNKIYNISKFFQGYFTTSSFSMGAEDHVQFSIKPVAEKVISLGAPYISTEDFFPEEIKHLFNDKPNKAYIRNILNRIRIKNYFNPPTDELILGTIDIANTLKEDQVSNIVNISQRLCHPVDKNTFAKNANYNDPIETIYALKDMEYIEFEREEIYTTEEGKKVVQKYKKTTQESLFVKIIREMNIPNIVDVIIKAFKD